jgi:iron-sulfur cluster assembly protein
METSRETLLERLARANIAVPHDCGGRLACASCLVLVREGGDTLSAASEDEMDMLDRAGAAQPGARLACQALAGSGEVVVEIAGSSIAARAAPAHAAPVTLTEAAARYLRGQLGKRGDAAMVRLAVHAAGCSGLRYQLDYADRPSPSDAVFESAGVRIAVAEESLPVVQGTRLELVREGLAQRIRFDNPNARESCGCGESFTA